MRYNMLVVLQGIIIYWIFTSASLLFSLSRRHGMETHKVIFSIFFDCFLLLSFCALVVPLLYKYSELLKVFKIWVSSWSILKVNATARLIVRISGSHLWCPYSNNFLLSCWSFPQLSFVRRHAVHKLRFSLVDPLFRELTFSNSS